MPRHHSRTTALLIGALLSFSAATSLAQPSESESAQAGRIHAMFEFCNVMTPEQLTTFSQNRKAAILKAGTPPEIYQDEFSSTYKRTLTELKEAGQEERELTCQPLRAMAGLE